MPTFCNVFLFAAAIAAITSIGINLINFSTVTGFIAMIQPPQFNSTEALQLYEPPDHGEFMELFHCQRWIMSQAGKSLSTEDLARLKICEELHPLCANVDDIQPGFANTTTAYGKVVAEWSRQEMILLGRALKFNHTFEAYVGSFGQVSFMGGLLRRLSGGSDDLETRSKTMLHFGETFRVLLTDWSAHLEEFMGQAPDSLERFKDLATRLQDSHERILATLSQNHGWLSGDGRAQLSAVRDYLMVSESCVRRSVEILEEWIKQLNRQQDLLLDMRTLLKMTEKLCHQNRGSPAGLQSCFRWLKGAFKEQMRKLLDEGTSAQLKKVG